MNTSGVEGTPWPTELRLREGSSVLAITFDDGQSFELAAEFLRVESPSAEVKGHGPGQEVTVGGKRSVSITGVEPVGNYAVRVDFSDGHNTGIFSWDYLRMLGTEHDDLWATYLEKLEAKGLTRD